MALTKFIGDTREDSFIRGDGANDTVLNEDVALVWGGGGDDTLTGGPVSIAKYRLYGEAGDDTVSGSVGTERLYGGVGNDVLAAWQKNDRLFGGADNDRLSIATAFNDGTTAKGGTGDDTFLLELKAPPVAGNISLNGGAGFDVLFLYTSVSAPDLVVNMTSGRVVSGPNRHASFQNIDVVVGLDSLSSTDFIIGTNGFDRIFGRAGGDFIQGGGGPDQLIGGGGGGSDTLMGQGGHDLLVNAALPGGFYDERYYTTSRDRAGPESLYGGLGNDTLVSSGDDVQSYGGRGKDVLIGTSTTSVLHGGSGNDVIRFGARLNRDSWEISGGGVYSTDMFTQYYRTVISMGGVSANGGAGTDTIDFGFLSPSSMSEIRDYGISLDLTSGAGTVRNGAGVKFSATGFEVAYGSTRSDDFIGTAGGNLLVGRDGNDVMRGLGGADELLGEDGNDTLFGGDGGDYIEGNDGADRLFGNVGQDILEGDDGIDTLFGGDDDDRLSGGKDEDTLRGGKNNDTLNGGASGDALFGGEGKDSLFGGGGRDILTGGDASDVLYGGSFEDSLYGGGGRDELLGGKGDDRIEGGRDLDRLAGEQGNDVFVFRPGSSVDIILDFNPRGANRDMLDLTAYEASFGDIEVLPTKYATVDSTLVLLPSIGDQVILLGVSPALVGPSDFLF